MGLDDENFRMHIKMMTCMSFLPVDEVTASFEALQESPAYDPRMHVIFNYFEDNYVGRVLRNGNHRAALFAIDMWNTFICLEEGLSRTNNVTHSTDYAQVSCALRGCTLVTRHGSIHT